MHTIPTTSAARRSQRPSLNLIQAAGLRPVVRAIRGATSLGFSDLSGLTDDDGWGVAGGMGGAADPLLTYNDGTPPVPGLQWTDAGWQNLSDGAPEFNEGNVAALAPAKGNTLPASNPAVTVVNIDGQTFYKWVDENGSTRFTEYDPTPQSTRDPVPGSNADDVKARVVAGAGAEGDLRLELQARDVAEAARLEMRQGIPGVLRGLNQAGVETVYMPRDVYISLRDQGLLQTGLNMVGGMVALPGVVWDADRRRANPGGCWGGVCGGEGNCWPYFQNYKRSNDGGRSTRFRPR